MGIKLPSSLRVRVGKRETFFGGRSHVCALLHSPIAVEGTFPFEVLRDAPRYDRATPSEQTEAAKTNARGAFVAV